MTHVPSNKPSRSTSSHPFVRARAHQQGGALKRPDFEPLEGRRLRTVTPMGLEEQLAGALMGSLNAGDDGAFDPAEGGNDDGTNDQGGGNDDDSSGDDSGNDGGGDDGSDDQGGGNDDDSSDDDSGNDGGGDDGTDDQGGGNDDDSSDDDSGNDGGGDDGTDDQGGGNDDDEPGDDHGNDSGNDGGGDDGTDDQGGDNDDDGPGDDHGNHIEFYRDSNDDGQWDDSDDLLTSDDDFSDGWDFSAELDDSWGVKNERFFAVFRDDAGAATMVLSSYEGAKHSTKSDAVTFTDADGDVATFKLTGTTGDIWYTTNPDGTLATLYVVNDQAGKGTLSATVKKSAAGDGRLTIGSLRSLAGGLDGAVSAQTINFQSIDFNGGGAWLTQVSKATFGALSGSADVDGEVENLTLERIETDAALEISGLEKMRLKGDFLAGLFIVTGDAQEIRIDGSAAEGASVNVAGALKTARFGSLAGVLTVGSAQSITIDGDFTGTLHATSAGFGKVNIKGAAADASITALGDIETLLAQSMSDVAVRLGLRSATAQPLSLSEFDNTEARLGKMTVKDSAARITLYTPTAGTLDLGDLDLSGSASTIAAGAIDDVRFATGSDDYRFDKGSMFAEDPGLENLFLQLLA